jgi:Anti-sigma-K factor rskA, C-terminal
MLRRRPHDKTGDQEVVELAALADGTLAPERRDVLEARVAESPELADRLSEQERAVALAQSAAAEFGAPARLRARVEAQRQVRRAPAPRRLVLAGAAAAAAAAVAVALSLALIGSSGQGERVTAALGATDLAPGASGEATLTKTSSGWRVELHANGLPRLAGGRFYEAWLRNGADVLVPLGTFNDGRKVTLWAGVSPKEFTSLTVTRELADGDQASSGQKVLVGTVDTRASG